MSSILRVLKKTVSTGFVAFPGLDLFLDGECTQPLGEINWGYVRCGETVTRRVFLKNTGNITLTLGLNVTGWNPPGASIITISWDYHEGTELGPGVVLGLTLSCTVPEDVSGIPAPYGFANTITISGYA